MLKRRNDTIIDFENIVEIREISRWTITYARLLFGCFFFALLEMRLDSRKTFMLIL